MANRNRQGKPTQPPTTMMHRLLLAVASVVVTLFLAEIALRATHFGLVSPELSFGANARNALERGEFVLDRHLFWKQRPEVTAYDTAIKAVHPDRPVPPKGNLTRVLVLGDSCSRLTAEGLPYPASLQSVLRDRAEVLTAAVPGYTSWQGLAWLKTQLLAAKPDIVIAYFGWNDHWRSTQMEDRRYAARMSPWRPRLLSLLQRTQTPPPLRVPAGDYAAILEEMARLVKSAGGQVVFVRAPCGISAEARARLVGTTYLLPTDDPNALHAAYLRALDEVAAAAGAPEIDAAGVFAAVGNEPPLLLGDGIHLTPLGHRVMAAIVAETIAGRIPGLAGSGQPLDGIARQVVAASMR